MKGAEKQIRYASSIISNTIEKMEKVISDGTAKIESYEASMQVAIPGYVDRNNRKTLDAWKEVLDSFKSADFETAAEVIEIEKSCGWFSYFSQVVSDITGNGSAI